MAYYFAYGARMSSSHMLLTSPNATAVGPASIEGYRLVFNVQDRQFGGGAANAIPDPTARLWGVLWEVDEEELTGFDSFRGDEPSDTHGVVIEVQGPHGPVSAKTMMLPVIDGFVAPADPYLRALHAGARAHGLPRQALDAIDLAERGGESENAYT
jgi:Gamma-glutamyl cyclotransferase, AIG2-like